MLNNSTISKYVRLEDMLQSINHRENKKSKVNQALVLTTALLHADTSLFMYALNFPF